mmetsp:Transcript_53794/g.114848  ORF Transcript_53794/g.114848 Transcript_53794/m.114848 type:complete len:556 (-) Transcript_53794:127-1794(-)
MGKNQHSKDGLHLRPTEWAQDGRGFKARARTPFTQLALHCCALSLQPFENPVGTVDGAVFEASNIIRYIKRFGRNPITGGKLETKELIPLHFSRNSDGQLQCPVTFKVFTNHSHVVLNTVSGHIYSNEAVQELNRKQKNWKDLMTGQDFKLKDLVTIQDPDDAEKREIAKFYYIQKGQQEEVIAEVTHRESKILAEQQKDTLRKNAAIDRIFEEKEKLNAEKTKEAEEKVEQQKLEEEEKEKARAEDEKKGIVPVRKAHVRYSSGAMAASFTSTTRALTTQNELRMQTEEEALQDLYEVVRKKKAKGYVRLVTSEGLLNVELHCDIVPRTCDNFLRLCEKEYYNDSPFHRLIRNFMLQGGDPTGTGKGGKSAFDGGRAFKDEFDSRLSHQGPGILSMANNGTNTNRSQFFVTLKSCQHLDLKHSVFGRVVGGLQLLDIFNNWETEANDKPSKPIKLLRTEVFKNPFREAIQEAANPKVEKTVDHTATWFSNRRDPMGDHHKRTSTEVGKYMEEPLPAAKRSAKAPTTELPDSEMDYVGVAQKSKLKRSTIDGSIF